MGNDPLSPESLAAVPEVQKWFWELARQHQNPRGSAEAEIEAENALLLAVRDATLKAERDRLLALTPEAVVEAAKDTVHAAGAWCGVCAYGEPTGEFPGETVGPCADCMMVCRSYVRAALPVLLAPTHAKLAEVEKSRRLAWECEVSLKEKHHALRTMLEQAEARLAEVTRERDEARSLLASTQQSLAMVTGGSLALEQERDRFKSALEQIVTALPDYWAGGVARAALGGAK